MAKSIRIFVVVCVTSMFLFPFIFSFLPFANTKMCIAVLGLFAYLWDRINDTTGDFDNGLRSLCLMALGVSFCSFLSMTVNNTPDDSYLGYIISMLVWLFAAYFCVFLMKNVNGHVSIETVCYYMLGVALLQCTIAILLNVSPFLKDIFDTYITGAKFMGVGVKDRLFGVGCALDVGGGRLGAILIAVTYLILLAIKRKSSKLLFAFLLSSFLYISIIGNMIGRTTSVGIVLSLFFFLYSIVFDKSMKGFIPKRYVYSFIKVLFVCVIICIGLYNTNGEARKLIRFGFEGFFNYFENGSFETNSTNMLSRGMIFPDNLRDWIIGHGYMASGTNDPYYLGPGDYGFYMNTDAGYSRFIFYFGLTGLSVFIFFFINVCRLCMKKIENLKFLFIALLLMNLGIWIKVSTDIFVIFAPFLCVTAGTENPNERYNLNV